jgi:pyruvate kinase
MGSQPGSTEGTGGHRRLRNTKVIGTIGPACDQVDQIRGLIAAGLNVARLNFSHGSQEQHAELAARVRKAAESQGANVAIMGDTRGPEIRSGRLEGAAPVTLVSGARFQLFTDDRIGNSQGVSVDHRTLPREVAPGRSIYLDDGSIQLQIEKTGESTIDCVIIRGGDLGERKGVTAPGALLSLPTLGASDVADLQFAAEQGFDYIAASFVRSSLDIERIRDVLRAAGANIPIIAKIEHPLAIEYLEEIVVAADGTMVARGDLGVEMPVEQVPLIQKRIIRTTVSAGKPVITATQMLDSMERNARPTRAEASDVANAILDGTSAVMLSGETAKGAHPLEAVAMMGDIAREAEDGLAEYGALQMNPQPVRDRVTDAVAHAACTIAQRAHACAILTLTESGHTPRAISKHRPSVPIFAVTSAPRVVRRLALNWGVTGLLKGDGSDEEKTEYGLARARELCGDPQAPIVVTAGISRESGSTNLVRVAKPED